MGKDTFVDRPCNILKNKIEPKSILLKFREPLSVQKQMAVTLYKLTSCTEYRVEFEKFLIFPDTTVKKYLYRAVNTLPTR